MSLALMTQFGERWSARDLDGCMNCFSDDAVYAAAIGPEPGTTYAGKPAIRAKLAEIFADATISPLLCGRFFPHGEVGLMEWSIDKRMPDGTTKTIRGIDLYAFRDGLITLKDSYRKTF
ncbi:nuclear transport factor 2 family protein [Mesorhizobium sp. B2-3-4]|uniref:nuclear transport factor 2 family protein n=1 Tax=Mesorhizobium sp. B2-3-4 TaxID=2589959 RepID=UPI0011280D47|nr:nuclear transport factor 2 family protein [Mesorhizobium sp. B2-3-4]TPM40665.1 nuclear transport factor 2 family protein [Mesorhizobium sp. B2-3-4]